MGHAHGNVMLINCDNGDFSILEENLKKNLQFMQKVIGIGPRVSQFIRPVCVCVCVERGGGKRIEPEKK